MMNEQKMVESLNGQVEEIDNTITKYYNYAFSKAFVEDLDLLIKENMEL